MLQKELMWYSPLIPLIRLDITLERNRQHNNPYIIHVIPFEMPFSPRQLTVITPLCNKAISVTGTLQKTETNFWIITKRETSRD